MLKTQYEAHFKQKNHLIVNLLQCVENYSAPDKLYKFVYIYFCKRVGTINNNPQDRQNEQQILFTGLRE